MKKLLMPFIVLIVVTAQGQSNFTDPKERYKCAGHFYIDDMNWLHNTGTVYYRMQDNNQNPLAFDFGEYHDSLAYFRMEPKGKPKKYTYGYMDMYFGIAVPAKYKSAGNFNHGFAKVSDGERNFYIDKKGNEVTEAQAKAAGFEQVIDKMNVGSGVYDSISPFINSYGIRRVYVRILEKDDAKELAKKDKEAQKKKDKEEMAVYLEKARIESAKKLDSIFTVENKAYQQFTADMCRACGGTGITGGGSLQCGACGGSGGTSCMACGGSGRRYSNDRTNSQYCSSCNGSGKKTCSACNGSGKRKVEGMRCPVCKGTGKKV